MREYIMPKASELSGGARCSAISRETGETKVELALNIDEQGDNIISTGVGFFNHMLNLLAFRAGFTLNINCVGDIEVDCHHTVEDVGIVLGKAINDALGDKKGIARYGNTAIPMDEALARCDLDISGRGYLLFNAKLNAPMCGSFASEMTEEFFRALAINAGITLHINVPYGTNTHHVIEAIFKSVGAALGQAIKINGTAVSSTKGLL